MTIVHDALVGCLPESRPHQDRQTDEYEAADEGEDVEKGQHDQRDSTDEEGQREKMNDRRDRVSARSRRRQPRFEAFGGEQLADEAVAQPAAGALEEPVEAGLATQARLGGREVPAALVAPGDVTVEHGKRGPARGALPHVLLHVAGYCRVAALLRLTSRTALTGSLATGLPNA